MMLFSREALNDIPMMLKIFSEKVQFADSFQVEEELLFTDDFR